MASEHENTFHRQKQGGQNEVLRKKTWSNGHEKIKSTLGTHEDVWMSLSDTCIGQREARWEWTKRSLRDEILRDIVQSDGVLIPNVRIIKSSI